MKRSFLGRAAVKKPPPPPEPKVAKGMVTGFSSNRPEFHGPAGAPRTPAWADPDDKFKPKRKTEIRAETLKVHQNPILVSEDVSSDDEEKTTKTGLTPRLVDRFGDESTSFTSIEFDPSQEAVLYTTKNSVSLRKIGTNVNLFHKTFENITIRQATFTHPGEIWIVSTDPGFMFMRLEDQVITKVKPRSSDKPIRKLVVSVPQLPRLYAAAILGDFTVMVFCLYTKECKAIPKIENARELCFADDALSLFIITGDGDVHRLDLPDLMHRRYEGSCNIGGSAIAVSQNHMACGFDSGIINFYARCDEPDPLLLKTFKSFEKGVHHIKFNRNGTMLAFASKKSSHYLVLVDVPTLWTKTISYSKGHATVPCVDLAFSPKGKYFAYLGPNTATILQVGDSAY